MAQWHGLHGRRLQRREWLHHRRRGVCGPSLGGEGTVPLERVAAQADVHQLMARELELHRQDSNASRAAKNTGDSGGGALRCSNNRGKASASGVTQSTSRGEKQNAEGARMGSAHVLSC